jgi:RNA polymerase sigma-70 factor (ECF subfamily)
VRRYTAVAHAIAGAVVQSDADADDVVQDAFLIAFRKLASVRNPNEFKAWLLRIVRNRAYNVMEFQRLRSHQDLSGTERAAEAGDPASLAERSEEHTAISRALGGLKPVLREVFLLHDAEGFAHAEIARLLGTSEVMSRKHLMNARRILRDRLQRFRGDR